MIRDLVQQRFELQLWNSCLTAVSCFPSRIAVDMLAFGFSVCSKMS